MFKSKIIGLGYFVPENIITNDDLSKIMDTSDDWIQSLSGIKERRWATNNITTSDLAFEASQQAIKNSNIYPSDVDMIIVGTLSSDYFFPGVSAQLQQKLNLKNVGAFDIKAACSAFIYSLSIADQYIKTGEAKTILVVGAETQTKLIEKSTEGRDVAVLFGDGAGAAILTKSDSESEILSTHLHSDGKHLKDLWMEAPGTNKGSWIDDPINLSKFTPKMNGREVFRNAVTRFPEVINEALIANNLDIKDVKYIVPHQANYRISEAIAKKLNVKMDKVISNIHKYGNTTAASIPIALAEAVEMKKISTGDIIILAAFGAGFTWASAAIRW
jgi:3-oxoacyl-[acyl-carrier-protein] synthase-3